MAKLVLFPVLLVVGCLIAGAYGALHNQISYGVSPDYFHAFKFQQFNIPAEMHNRFGASVAGWHASWWMGVYVGLPLLFVGLIMPGWKNYLTHCLVAFAVVVGTVLAVGGWALADANKNITLATLPRYPYPDGVLDKVAFARAGYMHNYSYVGGFLGVITGTVYLVIARLLMAVRHWRAAGREEVTQRERRA